MKKRLIAMALCLCTAFSFTACSDDESEKKTEAKLTLGEYKGIKVDSSLSTVAEEDVQDYLDSVLKKMSTEEEAKEGTTAKGDAIKITYSSTIDGKEYKSGEGYRLNLTEDGFNVDGFVDGLIGKNIGDKVSLDLKIPEKFTDTAVAGKDVHFDVTIEAKYVTVVPEFTDEWVEKNFAYVDCKTKEDLLAYLENDYYITQIYNEIWQEVLDNATVESYDSEQLESTIKEFKDYQAYYIYSYYGYELADYLKAVGVSEDDFNKQMEESAKAYLKQQMVVDAIAKAEDIVVTDEIYADKIEEFAKTYGYDSVEEFESVYEGEDFKASILGYIVEEFVCENVVFEENYGIRNPIEEETTPAPTTEAATGDGASKEEATTGAQ